MTHKQIVKGIDAITKEQLVQIMLLLGIGNISPVFGLVPTLGPFRTAALLPTITEEDKLILNNVQKIVGFLGAGTVPSSDKVNTKYLSFIFITIAKKSYVAYLCPRGKLHYQHNDSETYLKWVKMVELVFNCHNLSEERKLPNLQDQVLGSWCFICLKLGVVLELLIISLLYFQESRSPPILRPK